MFRIFSNDRNDGAKRRSFPRAARAFRESTFSIIIVLQQRRIVVRGVE
jgi:hypothetical protein